MRKRPSGSAYIVAARRTALGRVGGLHRSRRLEDLTAPVVRAVLADCGLPAERVDEIVLGNATQGGNPARLVALAAGLPETASATTIDRQCGSGLDAILAAIRSVEGGEAEVVDRRRRRVGFDRALARRQAEKPLPDAALPAARAQRRARGSRGAGALRILGDAVAQARHRTGAAGCLGDPFAPQGRSGARGPPPRRRDRALRANAEEARDQGAGDPDAQDLARLPPFLPPDGT